MPQNPQRAPQRVGRGGTPNRRRSDLPPVEPRPVQTPQFQNRPIMDILASIREFNQQGMTKLARENPANARAAQLAMDFSGGLAGTTLPLSVEEIGSAIGRRAKSGVTDLVELLRSRDAGPITPTTLRDLRKTLNASVLAVDEANLADRQIQLAFDQGVHDSLTQSTDIISTINRATPDESALFLASELSGGANPGVAALDSSVHSYLEARISPRLFETHAAVSEELIKKPIGAKIARNPNLAETYLESATLLQAVDVAEPVSRPFMTADSFLSGSSAEKLLNSTMGQEIDLPLEMILDPAFGLQALKGAPPGSQPELIVEILGPTKFLDINPSKWALSADRVSGTGLPVTSRSQFLTQGRFEVMSRTTAAARGLQGIRPSAEVITLRQVETFSPITRPVPNAK